MTADRALPAAVVERVDRAIFDWQLNPGKKRAAERALAEFLAIAREQPSILAPWLEPILEERGLRVVRADPTSLVNVIFGEYNQQVAMVCWGYAIEGTPPLAELLEGREHE